MTELDRELADHYASQEPDEAFLDGLMEMEAAADTPPRTTWTNTGRLAVAATVVIALGAVGITVGGSMALVLPSRSAAEHDAVAQAPPARPLGGTGTRYTVDEVRGMRGRNDSGSMIVLKGDPKQPVSTTESAPPGVSSASNAHPRLRGKGMLGELPSPTTAVELQQLEDPGLVALGYIDANEGRGRYRDLPVIPTFTPSRIDPLSTFAMDVDTASWTRARVALGQGQRPDGVRTEEFVNAFRYDYVPPVQGPFAVSSEVVPSPFDAEHHLVRIGIQAQKVDVFTRKRAHVTFLVDVSGSMGANDKLGLVRSGIKELARALQPDDTLAIVTYAGRTTVELEPTEAGNLTAIDAAVDRLRPGGGTAMGAGIELAYGLAEANLEDGAINRVFIASDGDANVGARTPEALTAKLRAAADEGITLTTLGYGRSGYRDDVMEQLANRGDGHYHFVADRAESRRVLVDGLTGTLQTVARDAKIQVRFDPGAVLEWRQVGYENRQLADREFRDDAVDAGEVGAGHQVTALYEIRLAKPSTTADLGEVRLRWEAPGAERGEGVERGFPLEAPVRASLLEASSDTRMAVAAGTFAECLRGRPCLPANTLIDLVPSRPEYAERDDELIGAIRNARDASLLR